MLTFWEWLQLDERSLVDPAVVASYERAFHQGLETLITRTRDSLRRSLEGMRQFRFCNYIIASLVRNGVHEQFDTEDCLQRIVFRMLSPVGERGLPKETLFDLDLNRTFNLEGCPLEARFKTFLATELKNIVSGRIPALRKVQRPGSLSIGYGPGNVSPNEIPGRPDNQEMVNDLMELLQRNSTPDMPLVDLLQSILAGDTPRTQRAKFGHERADQGRERILQIVQRYAWQTQNSYLLRLLNTLRDFDPRPPAPPKPPKPKYPPQEQDYRSIVDVLERNGRAVNMAVLGRLRRRWLERAPRDPSSPHANRLADVLANMVADGVLAKRGAKYVPGPQYTQYLSPQEPAAAV